MLYGEFAPSAAGGRVNADQKLWASRPPLSDLFREALQTGGATLPAIISGFWRLSRGPGRLTIFDYFRYRLYSGSFTEDERRAFISDSLVWPICDRCSNPHWRAVTEDKWLSYSLLKQCGVACPDTLHIYDPSTRSYGQQPVSRNAEQFAAFLNSNANYPLFVKPNDQLGSFGACIIEGFDGASARLHDGSCLTAGELVSQVFGRSAFLFQAVVSNHPDILPLARRLATVRLINFVGSDGIMTPFAILKLPGGDNVADNFWRPGNMLAQLDIATGTVVRAVRGAGLKQQVVPEFSGAQIPMWEEVRTLNDSVARIFAPVAFNSLDIAVTPQGPLVIEVNTGSSFDLWQSASGQGFLQPEINAFFISRGCTLK